MQTNRQYHALNVCVFGGASSLPILIADNQGLFAAAGLDVTIHLTRDSTELLEGLRDQRFQIVHASPDNYVEWRDRHAADLLAWVGGSSGPLKLIAEQGITDVRQLLGREIAVDSPDSGFVSVLRKMLRSADIQDEMVKFTPLGGTRVRYEALLAGSTAATMLTLPLSTLALRAGCNAVADQEDVLPRLQGSCGASLVTWLENNPGAADTYLRVLCAAITWLNDPDNFQQASRFVAKYYELSSDVADEVRGSIMDPRRGWLPSAMIDPQGMEMVCALRRENGRPPSGPASSYYTFEPYRRVLGSGLLDT